MMDDPEAELWRILIDGPSRSLEVVPLEDIDEDLRWPL